MSALKHAYIFRILKTSVVWLLSSGVHYHVLCTTGEPEANKDWMLSMIPSTYRYYTPPVTFVRINGTKKKEPVMVCVTFQPHSVISCEPKTMDFSVHTLISISWIDSRIAIPNHALTTPVRSEDIPSQIAAKLWLPKIDFQNCKGCNSALVDASGHFQLYLSSKTITTSNLATFVFTCAIELSNYPFDTQQCKVVIENTGYLSRRFVYFDPTCFERSIKPKTVNAPPEFHLTVIENNNCTNFRRKYGECIEYVFHLRRQFTHHVMLVFIPSILIVILSWISFWLDPNVAAPRVVLGLTSLLTLATQFNNAQKDLPPVSTIKALDIWMFACLFMVFSSLIEFAVANYCFRKRTRNYITPKPLLVQNLMEKSKNLPSAKLTSTENKEYFSIIDFCARIIFPSVFCIFNIVFWANFVF